MLVFLSPYLATILPKYRGYKSLGESISSVNENIYVSNLFVLNISYIYLDKTAIETVSQRRGSLSCMFSIPQSKPVNTINRTDTLCLHGRAVLLRRALTGRTTEQEQLVSLPA